jgi:AraC-like DNA-binding protein
MEITFNLFVFIYLAASVLGFASGLVLLYFGIRHNPGNLPLAFGQLALSLGVWVLFSLESKLIVYWPFFFRTGSFFGLLFVPLPFLYVIYNVRKRTWRWYDFLHFMPALIYLIDFWPIFMLSNEQKLLLVQQDIDNLNRYALLQESRFFPPGFHQAFRTVLFSFYWMLQCGLMHFWIKSQPQLPPEKRIWKNWMLVFLVFQAGIWIPFYLTFIWIDKEFTYRVIYTSAGIWLVLSSFLLLFYPSLLYGNQPDRKLKKDEKPRPAKGENNPEPVEDVQKLEEVKRTIDQKLQKDALFLVPGFSINDLSKETGLPVYLISKSITYFTGNGFIDFINQQRIQYCVEKLTAGDWKSFTVEGIARECGFNNRNSFTNAFKKFKGISPSQFKEHIDATISE